MTSNDSKLPGRPEFDAARRRVSEHAYHTPLLTSRTLSAATGFDVERDFLVNKAFSGGGAQLATRTLDRPTSTLVFDAKTDAKVDDLMAAIKNLADFSGHAVCCSGVDISLIQFKDSMKLNVGAI